MVKQSKKNTAGERSPYRRYETEKQRILAKGLSPAECEKRIKELAKKRGV